MTRIGSFFASYKELIPSWKRLKQASAGLSQASGAKKIRKMQQELDASRRSFLINVGQASILPLLGLSAGGFSLIQHLSEISPREMIINYAKYARLKLTRDFLEYLVKMAEEAKMDQNEIEQLFVLGNNDGSGIDRLYFYSLVKRALVKDLLSPRYTSFMQITLKMLAEGKIKIKSLNRDEGIKLLEKGMFSRYDPASNTLEFFPVEMPNQEMEGIILHELFHAWQDHEQLPLLKSSGESQAHLVDGDYRVRSRGEKRNGWAFNLAWGGRANLNMVVFCIPDDIIKPAQTLTPESSSFKDLLSHISKKYYWTYDLIHLSNKNQAIRSREAELIKEADQRTDGRQFLYEKWREAVTNFEINCDMISMTKTADGVSGSYCKEIADFASVSFALNAYLVKQGQPQKAAEVLKKTFECYQALTENFEIIDNEGVVDGL